MERGVSKTPHLSRVKLSKALQDSSLNAVAGTGAEFLRSRREQSPVNRASTRDAAAVQATKRPLDEASEDPLPAKKVQLTQTDVPRPGAEQATMSPVQQPKPTRPSLAHASFLEEFVDPVPPPKSVNTFVVSEWLKSVGLDRDKRCRSDSHLQHSGDEPISRNLSRSAPEMGYARDVDWFAVPPTPASTDAPSYRGSYPASSVTPSDVSDSGRSSGRSLVEDPLYREMNLAANHVYIRSPFEKLPQHVADLVDEVRKDRDSPGPSLDQVSPDPNLAAFQWMGAGEPQVEEYFRTNIFPYPDLTESLQRSDRQPMAKHAVPNTGFKLKC